MKCYKVYGLDNRKDKSVLLKDLVYKHGEERGNHLYNIVSQDSELKHSFVKWWERNNDPLVNEDKEPTAESVEEWLDYIDRVNKLEKSFITNSFKLNVNEFNDISEGLTYYLTESLFEKGGMVPEDLLTLSNKNIRNIINNGLKKVTSIIEDNLGEDSPYDNQDRVKEIIKVINEDKKLFYKAYNNYLESKLGLSLNLENILSDDIESLEDKNTKDSAFNKSSIEFDTKDGAPASIKMLIASMPKLYNKIDDIPEGFSIGDKIPNELGLPTLVNYNSTFNFIQQKLIHVPGDIKLMINELQKLIHIKPELQFLIDKLNFNKGDNYTIPSNIYTMLKETRMRTEFVNQFNKSKLEFSLLIKDKDNNIRAIDANLDKMRDAVLADWASAFKIKITENPDLVNNSGWLERANVKEILNFIGVRIPFEKVDTDIIDAIRTYGLSSKENIVDLFNPKKNEGVKNRLLQLVDIYLEESDEVIDFQQYNSEGKLVYSITLNNYITSLTKDLSYYAGNESKLLELYPELFNNNYSQDSIILNGVKEGKLLKVGIYDGFKSEVNRGNGKSTKELKEKDLLLQRLTGVLKEGQYTFLRTADRGIENYLYFEGYKGRRGLLIESRAEAKEYYKKHLVAELNTIKNDKVDVAFFENNNKNLRVFGYTDKKGNSYKLSSEISIETMTKPGFDIDNNPTIDKFLEKMMDNIISNESSLLKSSGVYQQSFDKYIYVQDLVEKYKSIEQVETLFALNSHIGNIEATKVFIGDLAFFKNPSDIFKRMSMMNSTKDSLRTDSEIINVIGQLTHEFEKQNGFEKIYNDNKITTMTINDIETSISKDYSPQEKESLQKALGKDSDYYKGYFKINEADGFGYVTMDEYRRMGIRTNEWTERDELLYQNLAKGIFSYTEDDLHRYTMKKYQYTGKLFEKGDINIPAGRKFAFLPLIPGIFEKGSTLDKLNTEMLSNGVGMAFYESAAKFGHTSPGKGAYHTMYDENGNFNINLAENPKFDILDYRFLGNQLKIHGKPKAKISGTQRNKLIKQNYFENGQIIKNDGKLEELINYYDVLQSTKIDKAFKYLVEKLGVEIKEIKNSNGEIKKVHELNVNDLSKFVDTVIDQGLTQGFSPNELKALDKLKEIPVFDILPNKQKIESLITSSLKSKVIDNKRKGNAFSQASDVGFEVNVNDDLAKTAERHNLKFYRYALDKDGNLTDRLLPMEIMVPLPTGLIEYVIDVYGNGKKLTTEALSKFNKEIAKQTEAYEKDENDKGFLIDLITYSGFRIPTQDASSLEVSRVKKFFMPNLSNTVVVPKAIVAKTGSDFDIDKLNIYTPHYKLRRNAYKAAKKFIVEKDFIPSQMYEILENEDSSYMSLNPQQDFIDNILLANPSDLVTPKAKLYNESFRIIMKSKQIKVEGVTVTRPKKESSIEDMNSAQIENELLFTEIGIIMSPENHDRLLAPLDGTLIKEIVDAMRKDLGWTEQEIKDGAKDELHDVFTNKKNIEKFISFLSGKAGVGQVAVHITNLVLTQQAGLEMKALHNYFGLGKDSKSSIDEIEGENILVKDLEKLNLIEIAKYFDTISGYAIQSKVPARGTKENKVVRFFEELLTDYRKVRHIDYQSKDFLSDKVKSQLDLMKNSVVKYDDNYLKFSSQEHRKGDVILDTLEGQNDAILILHNLVTDPTISEYFDIKHEFGKNLEDKLNNIQDSSKGFIPLGRRTNDSNQLISEVLSGLITAYVDIAKDPYILDLNAVNSTANTILMMTRWGIKPKMIFYMMNQPIVKEYLKQREIEEAVTSDKGTNKQKKADTINTVLAKFGITKKKADSFIYKIEEDIENGDKLEKDRPAQGIYSDFTFTELQTAIQKNAKGLDVDKDVQLKVLDLFLEYQRQSKVFGLMIRSTSPDTQQFKNISILKDQVRSRQKVKDSKMFKNYDKMFDTFIGNNFNAKAGYFEAVKDLFASQHKIYEKSIDALKELALSTTGNPNEKLQLTNRIENGLINYILGEAQQLNHSDLFEKMFKGEKSIPKLIKKIKNIYEEYNETPNYFIDQLLPLIDDNNQGYDSMKFKTKKLNEMEVELLLNDFEELTSPEFNANLSEILGFKVSNLGQGLWLYNMIQSGIDNSPFSILKAIPSHVHFQMLEDSISKYVKLPNDNSETRSVLDISRYTGFDTNGKYVGVGEFVLNNPGIFFNKFQIKQFKVNWDTKNDTFKITDTEGTGKTYAPNGTYNYRQYYTRPNETSNSYSDGFFSLEKAKREHVDKIMDSEITQINPNTVTDIENFLKSLGVDIKTVNRILDREGNPINAYGKASLSAKVIEMVEGANIKYLPEEAAHMITGMLGKQHPIIKQMMNNIDQYNIYKHVKRDYSKVYNGNESDIRFEAVGKLIATHIIMNNPLPKAQREQTDNWFKRVIRVLKRLLFGKKTTEPKRIKDEFELFAEKMVSKDGQYFLRKEIINSPAEKLTALGKLGKKYNISTKGYLPASTPIHKLASDLLIEGLPEYNLGQLTDGSGRYVFLDKGVQINPLTEFYSLEKSATQAQIKEKFLESANRFVGNVDTDAGKQRYQLKDKVLSGRVSDAQKELFEKFKTKEQIEKLQNEPKSIIAREVGTTLHDFNEEIMNYVIGLNDIPYISVGNSKKITKVKPTKPSNITTAQETEMYKSMIGLAKAISEQQEKIDKTGKAQIFTENFVIDDTKDVGGSQDLTVVYSDGSASIYDYKFINFKKQFINNKWVFPEHMEVNFMKEKSYNLQLAEYKRILKEVYGINKIRATRILPYNVQYKFKNKVPTTTISDLEGFKIDEKKEYLMPIPVANELTQDKNINKILSSLFKQQDSSILKLQSNYGNDKVTDRVKVELTSIKKSIKHIQLLNDFKPLFDSINVTLNNEANLLKDVTINDLGELNRMESEINLFNSLYEHILVHAKNKNLSNELDVIARRLADARVALRQKRNDLLFELDPDINIPQKEVGSLQNWFAYLSEINHPAFEMANDYFKQANGNIQKAVTEINSNLKIKHSNLEKWAKKNGVSIIEAFRKIKTDKNRLVSKFSKEFYQDVKDKREEGDFKWFKSQYKVTEEGKVKFKENLEAQKKLLNSRFEESSSIYKKMLDDWLNHNDLTRNVAWLDKWAIWKYTEMKDESKNYSDEYKNLKQDSNKELLEYYDFYVETNKHLNNLVGERIESNFIANIKKDFVEVLSQTGNPISTYKQLKEDFKDQFKLQYDGDNLSSEEKDIPLLYYNNFLTNVDGKWVVDESAKSEDLSKVLQLFTESVYRKKELSDIKDVIEALKIHVADQQVMATDVYGKIKFDEHNKTEPELVDSTKNADLFDTHVRTMLYGEKIHNKDSKFMEKYSTNKAITSAMKLFSANTLALSYVSAFGNVASGFANTYIKGAGGRYYSTKHIKTTLKLMTTRGQNDKYNHMKEYFKVENENWAMKMANKLSASKLTKNVTFDKLFTLWQKGDDFIANTILVSMSQNFGVHPETGSIKRMEELPEGTKSIFDMFERDGDNIKSGLTDKQFNDFRRRVVYIARRVKGSNTTEELSKIQTTVWGKSLMFFKNWIGPMASERFGGMKYTKDLQEFEYGRYRSLFKEVFREGYTKKLPKLLLDLVTLGLIKYKGNTELLTQQFEEFKKANPHLSGKIDINEYLSLRERSIREALFEMRILTGLTLLIMAAAYDWDDDGEKDYKKNKVTREMYKFVKRTYLELSFFSNPASVTELVRNPLPIISVGVNMFNIVKNTGDEAFDILTGVEGVEIDKTPRGHYIKKASIGKPIFTFFEDINKDD